MPYDTRAELVARLISIRTAIAKARTAESYGIGGDRSLKRPALKSLLEEEAMVEAKIEAMDAVSTGGIFNKVRFKRPI